MPGKDATMNSLTEEQRTKCHAIIHAASVAAALPAAGLAQLPCSDTVIITPIQIGMTISLAGVFGIALTEGAGLAMLTTAITATTGLGLAAAGRTATQFLVGWVPIIGNIVNSATAAGLTEAAGWVLANEFSKQNNCIGSAV
jgi:uncharacterized protein (DUF697 family)